MFTGIVEEIGRIHRIERKGSTLLLIVGATKVLEDIGIGDSIAVNGVCLTAVAYDDLSVTMDVMPETFRKSTLSGLSPGSAVNLERAMAANGRFGGHFVQGHVDSVGLVRERKTEENAVVFRIAPERQEVLRLISPTGSIAIDGISLTVTDVSADSFGVSIIPHTLAQTVLNGKRAGDRVNLEGDMLAKYMERLLTFGGRQAETRGGPGLSLEKLVNQGFV